ncbi:hypothetical protein V8G54_026186 [Vigna mungo]|uniref:Uncharacterized protein n=1 Tax=Vigna mungo TaxID=3915 RepID=A0AAQ3MZT3_VIGMU
MQCSLFAASRRLSGGDDESMTKVQRRREGRRIWASWARLHVYDILVMAAGVTWINERSSGVVRGPPGVARASVEPLAQHPVWPTPEPSTPKNAEGFVHSGIEVKPEEETEACEKGVMENASHKTKDHLDHALPTTPLRLSSQKLGKSSAPRSQPKFEISVQIVPNDDSLVTCMKTSSPNGKRISSPNCDMGSSPTCRVSLLVSVSRLLQLELMRRFEQKVSTGIGSSGAKYPCKRERILSLTREKTFEERTEQKRRSKNPCSFTHTKLKIQQNKQLMP